ncbi:homospermidine synthase [Roseateles oligotrophus]|uniref:Saccharopine dehydrogenase NADP-binding domain-containing protein n=1 Tax=Roseateles oligotrophus TaxID=1769250 RepID=A0ABT2YIM6_9BURK|nr:saccharopine dehydrogenase C-terminal domain-containing protein [Roseateles oligotrophus]MCV2369918.1 saccharopine dehydrogenase NADP-binding domain-containing protein [Roseateles oligotrophus]
MSPSSLPESWRFDGRLVMVGFGCIGQGVLPLLLRHLKMRPDRLLVLAPEQGLGDYAAMTEAAGVRYLPLALTPENYQQALDGQLSAGDFLLNLSVNVSSVALIGWCQAHGVLYLDTCIEPWLGGYIDPALGLAERTNYALREAALALRHKPSRGPTALLTHGANPGLVSHFVKQALLTLARDQGLPDAQPCGQQEWAGLAERLDVRVIHIAERDTQSGGPRKQLNEFVNTWSVEAFVDEGRQPAELGWGSHERALPADGRRHQAGSQAAIYLQRPGAATRVRSWTPLSGPMHAFLITHAESISIANYLTLGDPARPRYRPTVHYAYHPCDDAVLSLHELAGRNWQLQSRERVLKEEISSGIDELGVLLMGHASGAYWYGSRLSIGRARELCPHNSATSLQVTAAVLAGVLWAIRKPDQGLLEPDELPFEEIIGLCGPYLGEMVGAYSDWTPLQGRGWLFDETLDLDDPWQFCNFRVT